MTGRLDCLVDRLARTGHLHEIYLRGSHARGATDALSDLDLVLVLEEAKLGAAIAECCAAVTGLGEPVLPWPVPDLLVGDFGGRGAMLFLATASRVTQVDLYLLPSCRRGGLTMIPERRLVWQTPDQDTGSGACTYGCQEALDEALPSNDHYTKVANAFVAVVVATKKIRRGDHLAAAHYRSQMERWLAELIRAILRPGTEHYGMLDWNRHFAAVEDPLLIGMERLIATRHTHSRRELLQAVDLLRSVAAASNDDRCQVLPALADWAEMSCG